MKRFDDVFSRPVPPEDRYPPKRFDVGAKISENSALNDPERRDLVRQRISDAKRGRPAPWMKGERNPRSRPEERERITGSGNPNARSPLIHGVAYGTLQEAAAALGVAQATTIRKRIDRGTPGYGWARAPVGRGAQMDLFRHRFNAGPRGRGGSG